MAPEKILQNCGKKKRRRRTRLHFQIKPLQPRLDLKTVLMCAARLCVKGVYKPSPVGTYCITVSPHCIFTKAGTKFQHPKHSRAPKSKGSLTILNKKTFQAHHLACFVSAQTPPCPRHTELSSQHVDRKGWGCVRGEMDDTVALFQSIC